MRCPDHTLERDRLPNSCFAIVTQNEPAARLQIFGTPVDQEYYNQLLRLVTELGLENSVHFKSFTSNMRQVYTDAEFFVVPSLATNPGPESFCRIITEAWAFEKPSVAFAVGGALLPYRPRS